MKRRIGIITIGLVILSVSVMADNSQFHIPHKIVIDTDCGLDDFRALCMISQIPELDIVGITTVSGITGSDIGIKKINDFLVYNNLQGIPASWNLVLPPE